jgi:hypothetical protein
MSLPITASVEDVQAIVDYLKTKATGSSISEAKAVVKKEVLDYRKINAYVAWGIVSKDGERLKLASFGRELSRAKPENIPNIYAQILHNNKPYHSTLEWMFHQNFDQVTNVEVASHWHEHNKSDLGTDNERTIRDMANSFLRLCHAAGLGQLTMGRKGLSTRFLISKDVLGQYIGEGALRAKEPVLNQAKEDFLEDTNPEGKQINEEIQNVETPAADSQPVVTEPSKHLVSPRIFISHSKNMEIVDQIKTMLELNDINYEIAEEEETAAIPIPEKVFSAMRKCNAAAICITADENEKREDGTYGINQNVLIEIGSAFVLYDKKVVLVWDKRIPVPSNLQGLYRCEFAGDELSWNAGMKLMKALSQFKAKPTCVVG